MIRKAFNRLRHSLSPAGPYRFLIRNWSGLDDVNLVAAILGTETFRRILRSQPLKIKASGSMLVLAPHQDDELIGAGGLCIQARKNNVKCSIMFLTDGAETGLGRQNGSPIPSADVVKLRAAEAREVCKRLGADYHELGISNIDLTITLQHVDALAKLIMELRPAIVVLPWVLDGAPKHRIANHLLWMAARRHNLPDFEVWGYQVNNSPLANGVLDISKDIDEKIDLLRLYVSQNELLRRYDYQAWGLSAWNARYLPSKNNDTDAKYAELFCILPKLELFHLVEQFYLRDLGRTYLGHPTLAANMAKVQRQIS